MSFIFICIKNINRFITENISVVFVNGCEIYALGKLLELQKKHIEELISFACKIKEKGVNHMSFNAFSKTEMEQYAAEVKERWGSTNAYKEYEEKAKKKSNQELTETAHQLLSVFTEIGSLKELSPDEKVVQEKIEKLQKFITDN